MPQLGTMMPTKEREESIPSFESGRAEERRVSDSSCLWFRRRHPMTQLGTMMPYKEREESIPSFESGRAEERRVLRPYSRRRAAQRER